MGLTHRTCARREFGVTLLELVVVLAIIGVFSLISMTLMEGGLEDSRAKAAVRDFADLFMLARSEAIRTGDNHLVFFEKDAQDQPLTSATGRAAAAVVIRDANENGKIDTGDSNIASVLVDNTGSLQWGATFAGPAALKAPNDNVVATFPATSADFTCCTLTEPDDDPARWVMFQPDGIPRSFSIDAFATGDLSSGGGAVYVTSSERDFAVVLTPLGTVRVHAHPKGGTAWVN